MRFEWDEDKNLVNSIKHGVCFEDACQIFDGFTLDRIDDRFDYGEIRVISIGSIEDIIILTVVHTNRDGAKRLISARLAKKREREAYAEALHKAINS